MGTLEGGFQVNSTITFDFVNSHQELQSHLFDSRPESIDKCQKKNLGFVRLAKTIGIAISIESSSISAMPDPWLVEKFRRDAAVTMSIYQEIIGRFISRSEALKLARRILEQAEQERLAIAEMEAARGIDWEPLP